MAQWSLDFDGSNDYVGCGDLPAPTPDALTMECWVRIDVDDAAAGIVSKWDSVTEAEREYSLEVEADGDIVFKIRSDQGDEYSCAAAGKIIKGEWQHIAGVYDGSDIFLYIDGVQEATAEAADTINSSSQALEFGRTDGGAYLNGALAYVRISDSARYTATFTAPKLPAFIDANTLAQWDFIEGQGTSLNNREGTATYDGTISGATWKTDLPSGKWTDSYQRWGDAWTIFVNSVDRTAVTALDSVVVTQEMGSNRETAVFRLEDVSTAVTVKAWQHVQIWHGGTLMFGGVVMAHDLIPREINRDIVCHCVDWTALLSRRFKATEAYTADTCADILADIFDVVTEIDATTYVSTGATIDYEVDYDYIDEIVDQLAEASGYSWYVREDEEGEVYLHFGAMSGTAPFNLSTSPDMAATFPLRVLQWSVSGSDIVNDVQFVITEATAATEYTTGGTLGDTVVYDARTLVGTSNNTSITEYGYTLQLVVKCQRGQTDAYTADWLAAEAFEKTTGSVRIWQAGIRPGMTIHIDHDVLDVDADYIVRRVQARPEGGSAVLFELQVGDATRDLTSALVDIAKNVRRALAWDRENVVVRSP